jgi:hypothetical protein
MTESQRLRLVEILSVLIIVLCVVAIAVPKSKDVRRHADALQLLNDVESVRTAAFQFYSDSAYFPAESPDDAIPPSLTRYLPAGFGSGMSYGAIRYKSWPTRSGSRAVTGVGAGPARVIGAMVTTTDPHVGADAVSMTPGTPEFTVGEVYTFIFFGS